MDDLESELCLCETGQLGLRFAPGCPQIPPPARFLGAESYLVWQCLDCVLWGVEGQRPCCGHLSVPVTGAQSYNARVVGSELLEGN